MDPKKLRKAYMQCVPDLNKVMDHVKEQLSDLPPSDFLLECNTKPYGSVKRKMEANQSQYPKELSDLVRGRLYFSDQFNQEDVLHILNKLFPEKINDIDRKKLDEEHGLKYHGIVHVNLDFDGTKFELQVLPMEFQPYKEFLHQIYDKFRNPKLFDKLSIKQRDFLRKIHNTMYKKIDEQSKKNRSSND
jgi:hypothetical protein